MYESPAVLIGAPRILSITVWEILVYGCLFWSLFFIFKNQTYQTYQKKKKLIGHGPAFFLFDLFSNVL